MPITGIKYKSCTVVIYYGEEHSHLLIILFSLVAFMQTLFRTNKKVKASQQIIGIPAKKPLYRMNNENLAIYSYFCMLFFYLEKKKIKN